MVAKVALMRLAKMICRVAPLGAGLKHLGPVQAFQWTPCKRSKRKAIKLMRYLNTLDRVQVGSVWCENDGSWVYRFKGWPIVDDYVSRAAALSDAEFTLSLMYPNGGIEIDRTELTP